MEEETVLKEVGVVLKAEVKQEAIAELIDQAPNGLVTPERVIAAAEDPDHPLHDYFEWSDTEAARKFRLIQARVLIRSIKIDVPELNIKVKALMSVPEDRTYGGGYRWTRDVMATPRLRDQVIAEALRDLELLQSRYKHLTELAQVWSSIESVKHTVK